MGVGWNSKSNVWLAQELLKQGLRTCWTVIQNSDRDIWNHKRLGGEYIGLTLKWDCKNKEIHLFMAGYIQRALTWFHQKQPRKLQHQQYPHFPPNYGLWIQYAKLSNTVLLLELKQTKFIVDVAMTFLYYSQAVDSMMLITLSAFVVEQAKQTTTTKQQTKQFLDYATTNSKATIKCNAKQHGLGSPQQCLLFKWTASTKQSKGVFFLITQHHLFP